jgi:branched-chain amino acid transport system substrate-binding protein
MSTNMNIRRPGRRRLLNAATIALIGALALSACAVRKQYGVSTTVFTPKGNCDASRIVEVGAALDLSGPQAALGKEYLQGLKLAINQVNHNHGMLKNHRCIELLYKDTQGSPSVADKAVLDLVNNEVVSFMVAPFTAPEIVTSGADLGLAGVPTVSMSSLDSTTKPKPYPQLFPVTPPQSSLAQAAIKYARSQHWTSVAAIGENNQAGAEGVADFTADARKAGLTVTGSAHGADVSAEIQTLQSGNPQGLYVAGDDLGIGKIFRARQSASWTVPVVAGPDGADANVSSAGASPGISVIVPTTLVVNGAGGQPSDPSMVAFLAALQKAEGSAAFAGSVEPYAEAYDGVQLFAYVGTSINSVQAGDVRTFIENANYQGLLASYGYTSSGHIGVTSAQLTVVPLSSLSNGIFHTAAAASSTSSTTSTTVAGSTSTSTTTPGASTTTTAASSTTTTG